MGCTQPLHDLFIDCLDRPLVGWRVRILVTGMFIEVEAMDVNVTMKKMLLLLWGNYWIRRRCYVSFSNIWYLGSVHLLSYNPLMVDTNRLLLTSVAVS